MVLRRLLVLLALQQFNFLKVPSTSGESNGKEDDFVKGDSVLARWSDCRSYPASVLKQTEEGMLDGFITEHLLRLGVETILFLYRTQ